MRERKFEKEIGDLKDTKIGLFLGENQFLEGILLDVKQDHLVIDVNQNVTYIARSHIRALSKNTKDLHVSTKIVPFLDRKYLTDILNVLRYNWVTINGPGEQAYFGVLSRVSEDHIILINNAELLYIPTFYIASIYSSITNDQIIIANNREQQTNQKTDTSTMNEKIDDIARDLLESIQDSVSPLNDESNVTFDFTLEEEIQDVQQEAHLVEPTELGNRNVEQLENHQQNEIAVELDLVQLAESLISDRNESDNLQADFYQEKAFQLDEHPLELMDFKNSDVENPFAQIKREQLEELNLPELLVQDEANTSKVDDLEVMGYNPNMTSEELLSYTEPLGYERNFLLTGRRDKLKDKQAMISSNNLVEEKEFPEHDGKSIEMEHILDEFESLHHPVSEHHSLSDGGQMGFLSEEPAASNTVDPTMSMLKMSPKEERAMLEKQYYSLMKHAEGYSIQPEEHSERLRLLIHPVAEWQYLSLMNHAAKMYRQLRDL